MDSVRIVVIFTPLVNVSGPAEWRGSGSPHEWTGY
jgi:hypothetical protein